MSFTISGTEHKRWADYNLESASHSCEMEYVNQEEDGFDTYSGDWFASPDKPVTSEDGTFWVIFYGTFGNYNSPGVSHYTCAELYDANDPEEVAEYRKTLADWEARPEYTPEQVAEWQAEDEDDDDDEEDEEDETS